MKRKVLLAVTALLALSIVVGVMAGCTENYKTDALATEYSETVASNGGLAVVYGDYLYFINGNAGNTDIDNVYGKPTKGAIYRTLLKNGVPSGEAQLVVPKIVYGTDTSYGGLYIDNDFIYYSTPNSARDGSGDQKSSEMEIMRTKVDGTGTQKIASFEDFSVVFAVENNNLVYIRNDELHSIDLSNKKFPDTKVEENTILTNYKMVDGYLIYCMYNNDNTSDYIMKAYSWSGGDPITLAASENLRPEGTDTTYTMSLIDATSDDETFTAYFTLKDSALNAPEEGICSFSFDRDNPKFDKANMIRYTNNASTTENLNFTQFEQINDEYILVMSDTLMYIYKVGTGFIKTNIYQGTELVPVSITFSSEQLSNGTVEKDGALYYRYEMSSVIYQLQLFEIDDNGNYQYVEKNVEKLFTGSADTSYCKAEIINNVVYFMNSNVSNNIYYYVIPSEIDADTDYTDVQLLGDVTRADFISAVSE